jgi:hypothetical protein
MSVSRRVRQDFLSILPDKIELADGGVLRFNARRDTIVLVGLTSQLMCTIIDETSYSTSTACIWNLGIEVRTTDFICDFPCPGATPEELLQGIPSEILQPQDIGTYHRALAQ